MNTGEKVAGVGALLLSMAVLAGLLVVAYQIVDAALRWGSGLPLESGPAFLLGAAVATSVGVVVRAAVAPRGQR